MGYTLVSVTLLTCQKCNIETLPESLAKSFPRGQIEPPKSPLPSNM